MALGCETTSCLTIESRFDTEDGMANRPMVWVLANSGSRVDQKENLEKSAVFLHLMSDKVPREWGDRPRKVPAPALHDARIQIGIGLADHDSPEANQHYLAVRADTVHFNNPRPGYVACHELTAEGKKWAEQLLALYKAILPDTRANEFSRLRAVAKFLADAIAEYAERPDIAGVMGRIEQLLDDSVAANEYLIPAGDVNALFDLATVDWGGLEEAFKNGRPRTAAQRLKSLLSARIAALVRLNPMRVDLVERFEKLVSDYNAGSINVETFFTELVAFRKTLTEEEARGLAEGLDEEHLAVFDLLMRPAPELSADEELQVKRVADELLATLKRGKLVLDWRKQQATRAAVRVAIEETLDRLPDAYERQLYAQKCDVVYQHVFDSYWDDGKSVYVSAT